MFLLIYYIQVHIYISYLEFLRDSEIFILNSIRYVNIFFLLSLLTNFPTPPPPNGMNLHILEILERSYDNRTAWSFPYNTGKFH